MDLTSSLKIAEVEESVRQLTLSITNLDGKRKELNKALNEQKKLLNKLKPKMSPFEIFPQLVWEQISYEVKDTKDWLNLYSASPILMNLLEKDKLKRIFCNIFSLVCKYLKRGDVINLCEADTMFASAILSWVQVRYLSPCWADERWEAIYDDAYPNMFPVYHVESEEKVQVITKELSKGDSDFWIPFGFIFCDKEWVGMKYWERVETFLQLFGKRIWLCKLIFSTQDYYPCPITFPEIIIQCLRLIPNVIRLGLDYTEEDAQLPNPITEDNPAVFPRLSKLKVLSLVQESYKNFVGFLRLHADQLESLSIEGEHAPRNSLRYSKLKKLSLTGDDGIAYSTLDSFAQAPVSKLYITINTDEFEFEEMFHQLNRFGRSLESLDFVVYEERIHVGFGFIFQMHLPKLRRLGMWDYPGDYEFLLGIPSLQCLELNLSSTSTSTRNRNFSYKSNIWSLLSNLQKINFYDSSGSKTLIFTREEYNQYKRIH